jgi:hypothetical protein
MASVTCRQHVATDAKITTDAVAHWPILPDGTQASFGAARRLKLLAIPANLVGRAALRTVPQSPRMANVRVADDLPEVPGHPTPAQRALPAS